MSYLYDTVIIGSGPAGYSAAIYSARSNLKTIIVNGPEPGGQLMKTTEVENYAGFPSIQGPELMNNMKEHILGYNVPCLNNMVVEIKKIPEGIGFVLTLDNELELNSKTIIICTGSSTKWLGIPGEKELLGYGVSACATCDAFFFKNKKVAVVGGGDTAAEEAIFLANYASHVYLLHRRDTLRAKPIMVDRVMKNKNITVIWNNVVKEIISEQYEKKVGHIIMENVNNNKAQNLDVDGIFIAIGHNPNTKIFVNLIDIDSDGYIITDNAQKTSVCGIFAAGDVQDKKYRQAITSAGSGCKAALEAYHLIQELSN